MVPVLRMEVVVAILLGLLPLQVEAAEAMERASGAEVPELTIEVEVETERERPAKVEVVEAEKIEQMPAVTNFADAAVRLPGTQTLYGCLMNSPRLSIRGSNYTIGNPDLKPHSAWSYQLDWEQKLPQEGKVTLSLFRADHRDMIAVDSNYVYQNIGKARVQGLELSYEGRMETGTWWANYTLLEAKDLTKHRPLVPAYRTAPPKHQGGSHDQGPPEGYLVPRSAVLQPAAHRCGYAHLRGRPLERHRAHQRPQLRRRQPEGEQAGRGKTGGQSLHREPAGQRLPGNGFLPARGTLGEPRRVSEVLRPADPERTREIEGILASRDGPKARP